MERVRCTHENRRDVRNVRGLRAAGSHQGQTTLQEHRRGVVHAYAEEEVIPEWIEDVSVRNGETPYLQSLVSVLLCPEQQVGE